MTLPLETVVKQLTDSGILTPSKLEKFVPPQANPKNVDELIAELVKQSQLTKFQAAQVKAGKARALILGEYTLIDRIGAGGMGQVFKAIHRRMDRTVAIKMLPAAMLKDAAAVARFEREVRAAAKLLHPNIVAALDAGQAGNVHFLVMEYVDGQDLSALVKQHGPVPVGSAVHYTLQAARGLEFAHAKGVIHRDIKPANLLLGSDGVVKILDMGLARIDQAENPGHSELTSSGTIMGTVDYMSPEQALNTKHADQRADIYSLGISLYYLLAGKSPYGGETAMEKLMAHQTQPIPNLRDVQSAVPKQLEAIFKKMVAKKMEARYQSMGEVAAALDGLGLASSTPHAGKTATAALSRSEKKKLAAQTEKTVALGGDTQRMPPAGGKRRLAIAGGALGLVIVPLVAFLLVRSPGKKDGPAEPDPAGKVAAGALLPPGEGARRADEGAPRVDAAVALNAPHPGPLPKREGGKSPASLVAPFDAAAAKAGQQAWAKHLGTQVETTNSVGMQMTLIPPGEFLMGSTPEQVAAAKKLGEDEKKPPTDASFEFLPTETPQHKVIISRPFLIGSTEVTTAQFRRFVEASKYVTEVEKYAAEHSADKATDRWWEKNWKTLGYTDDMPVTKVAWNDACAYCEWLSKLEGLEAPYRPGEKGGWRAAMPGDGYRLPSEAQWEYACRAGTATQYSFGDDITQLDQYSWFRDSSAGNPHPVGTKRPNSFGLFDMHGNAVEWCEDGYDAKWYEKSPPLDPLCRSPGAARVLRGGMWLSTPSDCRSTRHFCHNSTDGYYLHGFRVVRPLDVTEPATTVPAADFALEFNGGQEFVTAPLAYDGQPPLTIEGWLTPQREQGDTVVIGVGEDHRWRFTLKYNLDDWHANFAVANEPAPAVWQTASVKIPPGANRRDHVAVVWDGLSIQCFVNGQPGQKTALNPRLTTVRPAGDLSMSFGRSQGIIDEVRISKSVRYTSAFTPQARFTPDADTLALYHFDEGTGDQLADSSGHNHHGKITGARWVPGIGLPASAAGLARGHYESGRWIDVIPLIDPALDAVNLAGLTGKNDWRVEKGALKYLADGQSGKLLFPVRYLGRSWELELDFTGDGGSFVTDIPLPDGLVELKILPGGIQVKQQQVVNDPQPFRAGKRVKVGFQVSRSGNQDQVDVKVNDAPRGHWTGDLNALKKPMGYKEPSDRNGLYVYEGGITFHAIRIRMLNGGAAESVRPLPGDTKTASQPGPAPQAGFALGFDGQKLTRVLTPLLANAAKPLTVEAFVDSRAGGKRVAIADENGSIKAGFTLGPRELRWWTAADVRTPGPGKMASIPAVSTPRLGPRHLAAVFDGQEVRFYVDGALQGSARSQLGQSNYKVLIGGDPVGGGMHAADSLLGTIDEVRISSVARYTADFTPAPRCEPDPNTEALYHFDEGTGTVAKDASSHHRDAEIHDAEWIPSEAALPERLLAGQPTDVLLLGDGFMERWDDAAWDKSLPGVARVKRVINGVGIDALREKIERGEFAGDRPRVVIVQVGWNDFKTDSPPNHLAKLERGYGQLITALRVGYPQAELIITGVVPSFKRPSAMRAAADLDARIAKLADGRTVHFFDLRPVFLEKGELREDLAGGAKVEPLGYERWAAAIKPLVTQCLSRTPAAAATAARPPLLPPGEGGRRPDEGAPRVGSAIALNAPHPGPLPKGEGVRAKLAYLDPAFQQWVTAMQALPADKQIEAVSKKLVELNPGFDGKLAGFGSASPKIESGAVTALRIITDKVTDVSPLRAFAALKELDCSGTFWQHGNLSDLSPLAGMRLGRLDFSSTKVSDLGPLAGMPLHNLGFAGAPVANLSPLAGMRLHHLLCFTTPVSDLTPLAGQPLETLHIANTLVTDLSPLRETPLWSLACDGSKVTDLSPLAGTSLTDLRFQPRTITKGLEVVRNLKGLKKLGLEAGEKSGLPAEEFWKKYDAGEFGTPAGSKR